MKAPAEVVEKRFRIGTLDLRPQPMGRPFYLAFAALLLWSVVATLGSGDVESRGAGFIVMMTTVLGSAIGLTLRDRWLRTRISLGLDGLVLRRLGRASRFIPWGEVVGLARSRRGGLLLRTAAGTVPLGQDPSTTGSGPPVRTPSPSGRELLSLALWIADAKRHVARAPAPQSAVMLSKLVERAQWEDALSLGLAGEVYRGGHLNREDLLSDLESPATPAEVRSAIAGALRVRVEETARLERTLEVSVSPDVRRSLKACLAEMERRQARDESAMTYSWSTRSRRRRTLGASCGSGDSHTGAS